MGDWLGVRYNRISAVIELRILDLRISRIFYPILFGVFLMPNLAVAADLSQRPQSYCVSKDGRDCFEAKLELGSAQVELIGATFFRWFVFDVYSAALYSSTDFASKKVFDGTTPLVLQIRYRREFEATEMIDASYKILRKQGAPIELMKDRLDRLNAAYKGVKDGDAYTLTYTPDNGGSTSLRLNDTNLVTIPGRDFAIHYFNIWLSERDSLDSSLRSELVNLKCDKPLLACI